MSRSLLLVAFLSLLVLLVLVITLIFIFKSYSVRGVYIILVDSSTIFTFCSKNLLTILTVNYEASSKALDYSTAADLSNQLRNVLFKATIKDDFLAYVNYAYRTEKSEQIYGAKQRGQQRLRDLKQKYDPQGKLKLSFYAPTE